MLITRRPLLAAPLLLAAPSLARAQGSWFPIRGTDGREVQNHRVPIELETEFSELDNAFTIGSPDADVTLIEIYDSNCGYCRRAASDVKAMVAADPDLAVTFINAPSLGLPSVQAARVEYAVKLVGGADRVLAFHEASMAARGVFDGLRALETAKAIGLDDNQIEDVADKPETGQVLVQATRLANATNLAATPSWLVSGTAIIGWPGRPVLESVISSIRQCDKPVCS